MWSAVAGSAGGAEAVRLFLSVTPQGDTNWEFYDVLTSLVANVLGSSDGYSWEMVRELCTEEETLVLVLPDATTRTWNLGNLYVYGRWELQTRIEAVYSAAFAMVSSLVRPKFRIRTKKVCRCGKLPPTRPALGQKATR
jgi:hypothetical protein